MNTIYLCRPGGDIIGTLPGIDLNSAKLKQQLNQPWDLSFDVYKYMPVNNKWVETPYYQSISDSMELYLDSDIAKARFVISSEPDITSDGVNEHKTVTAKSIDCELQSKLLKDFKINTGEPESLENLIMGNIKGEAVDITDTTQKLYNYNYNPYKNLPVEYIEIYNNKKERLEEEFVFTANDVYWKERDVTINYTVDSSTGVITAQDQSEQLLLVECFEEFIKKFERIQEDIRWVIDDNNYEALITPPDDKIVCVVDSYISVSIVDGNPVIQLQKPKYTYNLDTDGWHIATKVDQYTYSINRLLDGIDRLIDYYDKFGTQLSLFDLVLENVKISGWDVGDVSEDINSVKVTFTVDNQDIFSFLTNTFASYRKVVVDFDRYYKRVNVVNVFADDEIHDTGVVIGFHNLMNSIDIKTSSDDGMVTKFNVSGADDLGILYTNFGSNYIIDLDYYTSKIDQYGNRQYVTDDLYQHYLAWKNYRDSDVIQIENVPRYTFNPRTKEITSAVMDTLSGTRRELYIQLSKRYNQALVDVDEAINLVPNDGVRIDYTSFNYEDLCTLWTAYKNAFNALIVLYKADFGATTVIPDTPWLNISDRVEEANVKGYDSAGQEVVSILDTFYCHDFSSYYYNIIPNVLQALKRFIRTSEDLQTVILDANGDWIKIETGNPYYESDPDKLNGLTLEAYQYDMSLYGRDELGILKRSWIAAASKIFKEDFVKSGTSIDDYTYNTWSELTADQKANFMSESDYNDKLSSYLDYTSRTVRPNKLVSEGMYGKTNAKVGDTYRKSTKGVIFMAQDELTKCETFIGVLESYKNAYDSLRQQIADSVTLEQWGGFTRGELSVINTLIKEADYNNSNILTTNIDTLGDTVVDVQYELLEDAQKKLFEKSRPQYSFSANIDNLLAIPEFANLSSSIKLLNYIYLRIGLYDNETVRLRIVSIENNPLIPDESITLEFSNMTYTYDGLSDLTHLFESILGGSTSSGGSSSGGGSGGTYGKNDAEITISNNMLNALLKNRDYINSVSASMMQVEKILTDSLYAGRVVIGGYTTDEELANGIQASQDRMTIKFSNGNEYYTYNSNGQPYNIAIKSYGVPDSNLYPPASYNGRYYLNNYNGKLYISNGSIWSDSGIILTPISTESYNLSTSIDGLSSTVSGIRTDLSNNYYTISQTNSAINQKADSIVSTVAEATQNWDMSDLSYTINIYGYGAPTDDAGTSSGDYYLDQGSGEIWYSDGHDWTVIETLDSIQNSLNTKIEQTSDEVSISATRYDWDTNVVTDSATGNSINRGDIKHIVNGTNPNVYTDWSTGDYCLDISNGYVYKITANSQGELVTKQYLGTANEIKSVASIVAGVNSPDNYVKINADKIQMTGSTIFLQPSDVGASGSTVIDGGRITTGTIDAATITVDNLNAGNIKYGYLSADRIQAGTINIGKFNNDQNYQTGTQVSSSISTATSDMATKTGLSQANYTIINGGNITTGTIDASTVTVENIDASKITTGSIDASIIGVNNINANNITSGTINANLINASQLTVNSIPLSGIDITNNTTQTNLQGTVYVIKTPYIVYLNGNVSSRSNWPYHRTIQPSDYDKSFTLISGLPIPRLYGYYNEARIIFFFTPDYSVNIYPIIGRINSNGELTISIAESSFIIDKGGELGLITFNACYFIN